MFKWLLNDSLAFGYDAAINFIEAHEQASKMIGGVIDNQELCDIILKEANIQIDLAKKYVAKEVESAFPEIAK